MSSRIITDIFEFKKNLNYTDGKLVDKNISFVHENTRYMIEYLSNFRWMIICGSNNNKMFNRCGVIVIKNDGSLGVECSKNDYLFDEYGNERSELHANDFRFIILK